MKFRYEFPPEVEAEREPVFEAIRRGLTAATPASVAEASRAQRAWLERYPDDYAMWDIGETISLLADALEADSHAEDEKQRREEQGRGGAGRRVPVSHAA